jgi:hypothetical protein
MSIGNDAAPAPRLGRRHQARRQIRMDARLDLGRHCRHDCPAARRGHERRTRQHPPEHDRDQRIPGTGHVDRSRRTRRDPAHGPALRDEQPLGAQREDDGAHAGGAERTCRLRGVFGRRSGPFGDIGRSLGGVEKQKVDPRKIARQAQRLRHRDGVDGQPEPGRAARPRRERRDRFGRQVALREDPGRCVEHGPQRSEATGIEMVEDAHVRDRDGEFAVRTHHRGVLRAHASSDARHCLHVDAQRRERIEDRRPVRIVAGGADQRGRHAQTRQALRHVPGHAAEAAARAPRHRTAGHQRRIGTIETVDSGSPAADDAWRGHGRNHAPILSPMAMPANRRAPPLHRTGGVVETPAPSFNGDRHRCVDFSPCCWPCRCCHSRPAPRPSASPSRARSRRWTRIR